MPGIQQIIPYTTAAAATIANLLAGTPLEYWGGAGVLTLYGCADAVGPDTYSLSGYQGGNPGMVMVPAGSALSVASTVGAIKNNENFLGQFAIPANTRLVLSVTTTAAHTGRFQLVA